MNQTSTELSTHPMKRIIVSKVVVNIGVGKSGEPLEKAKRGLEELTGQRPTVRGARKSVRDFGIHKGEPIAAMVTLRRGAALQFLQRTMAAKRNILKASSFDNFGNLSIGIQEHIDLPDTKYNPDIGIFGMDVSIALTRPGYSIARKRIHRSIGKRHRITKDDAIRFFEKQFGAEVTYA
jgi:large subunit ribosomal protein L5